MKAFDFDLRFQERLVRLLFQDAGFAEAALPHLPPKLFESTLHQWGIKQLKQHLAAYEDVPSPLVIKNERKKAEQLGLIPAEEKDVYRTFVRRLHGPVADKTYVKKELQSFVEHQAIKNLILKAVDEDLPRKRYAEIRKSMIEVVDLNVLGDYSLGESPGETFEERIQSREENPTPGITTGVAGCDALMVGGGLPPGKLGAVLAGTGHGKTAFLINLACSAVLDGVPTLYISLELDEKDIMTRMDAHFTGVPMRLLRKNATEVRRSYRRIKEAVKRNLIVKAFPTGDMSLGDLRQYLRRLERKAFYPKLLALDYLDLARPRIEYADSSYETQGTLWQDARGFAGKESLALWTATQGNRDSLKAGVNDVDLSMTSDSIKKFMIADVGLGISQNPKEKKTGRGRLVFLKNRFGPSNREVAVLIDHGVCTFRSIIK